MTSCLLAKANDRLVAVADGRLSVSDTTLSFDTVAKIVRFTPMYRIPQVQHRYFVGYTDRTSRDWFVAYSGAYALAREIIITFVTNVSGGLFLSRDSDDPPDADVPFTPHVPPRLQDHFDESGSFDEGYNFSADEQPNITPDDLSLRLRKIAQTKCDEFARNRGLFPDCQFLLFGKSEVDDHYVAFKIYPVETTWNGVWARVTRDELRNGELTTIGSAKVAGEAHADEALNIGLLGWSTDRSKAAFNAAFEDFDFDAPTLSPGPTASSHQADNWTVDEVRARFIELVRTTDDLSVGGDIATASGYAFGEIKLGSA
jgi:hypothetical protein